MLGRLVFADKNSIDRNCFFESVHIIGEHGGSVSRYNFYREMELFLNGSTSLPETKPKDYREASRNPFNKTKAPRSYGFIYAETREDGEMYLNLTERGWSLFRMLELQFGKPVLPARYFDKFTSYIVDSLVYQSFGKNNNGLESTDSDIDPPKVLLKALMDLKWMVSEDSVFLVYGLQNRHYQTFPAAVSKLIELRKEFPIIDDYKSEIRSVLKEWSENDPETKKQTSLNLSNKAEHPYPLINLANDNKLIKGLCLFDIIYDSDQNEHIYKFNEETYKNNRENLKNLTPVSRPLQLIVSGVPGTGKSYFIQKRVLGFVSDKSQIIRTIIHPDYSYSDFVGSLSPTKVGASVRFIFKPGAFTTALKRAFEKPHENVYLVIEELNRGNMESIMGDIISLLDRIDDFASSDHGKSCFAIKNVDIAKFLRENGIIDDDIRKGLIRLPSNFNIVATINTADQNVYLLDSHLRRRFQCYYLPICFDDAEDPNSYLYELNDISKKNVFDNVDNHSWVSFAQHINSLIDMENGRTSFISEDKKLAPFFVTKEDVSSKENFCNKVLFYLQSDVFKYSDIVDRHSYQEIFDQFVKNNKDPFIIYEAVSEA